MFVHCWHGQTDTLPRLRRTAPDTVDVVLTVGINVELEAKDVPHAPTVEVKINGLSAIEFTAQMYQALVDWADRHQTNPDRNERRRAYADIAPKLQGTGNRYFEVTFSHQRYGDTFKYEIQYSVDDGAETGFCNGRSALTTYSLILLDPAFKSGNICATQTIRDDSHWWVLSRVSERGFDCLRLDMLNSIDPADMWALPPVKFAFPDGESNEIDVEQGAVPDYPLPIVNRNTDTVLICIRQKDGQPVQHVKVTTKSNKQQISTVVTLADQHYSPTRLLLLNYCIQGLNDLFAPPLPYGPGVRTYIQVTLRDELALYSSRPDRPDSGAPDGYAFTLEGHRYFDVKSHWVFNAGVLALIAHDCPDDFNRLKGDVVSGLLVPSNAGFGAHRPPYYRKATNCRELNYGKRVIENYLDYHRNGLDVYYPDQRLFKSGRNEVDAYLEAGVKYLVFDRSSVCRGDAENPRQIFPYDRADGNYLWTLAGTQGNIGVLLIEDLFRTNLFSWDDDLTLRGKADLPLRRRFMQLVTPANQQPRPLVVYGDDADKASGNGWFDGTEYDGHKFHLNEMYMAFLKWVSCHPWVEAVTTESLNLGNDSAGELDISSATCPSVDPGGAATLDQYGKQLHFDSWHLAWQVFPADWLGSTLRGLSDELEMTLIAETAKTNGELLDLGWMYFLMFTHESFWNKEDLSGDVNGTRGVLEPEDFVLAESLQQRHAWVFVYASRWADWAVNALDGTSHLDDGPLLDSGGPLSERAAEHRLHWDHDLSPNVIMYNDQVLLVMDLNGGCITNIFVRIDERFVSASGHFKSFQFLDTAHTGNGSNPGIMSNGLVFQNTVFTPNHAYVAADVQQAAAIRGTYLRPPGKLAAQDWNYPNNFNEYQYERIDNVARFNYVSGSGPPSDLINRDLFADCCTADRVLRGGGGRLVWHDPSNGEFEKAIRLDGRRIHIEYHNVPAGHIVSNEFCVDLYNTMLRGQFQTKEVADDSSLITLTSPAGGSVALKLGPTNCAFSAAALLSEAPSARPELSDYLMLHRVFTDNLQIECAAGGSFDYTIAFA